MEKLYYINLAKQHILNSIAEFEVIREVRASALKITKEHQGEVVLE